MIHVYFDLDNTLINSSETKLRPGTIELFKKLIADNIIISLWTASTEERAMRILRKFNLEHCFTHYVFREHYDPFAENNPKDIRYKGGSILVDDNASHIEFVKSIGLEGFLVTPFIKKEPKKSEFEELYRFIKKMADSN